MTWNSSDFFCDELPTAPAGDSGIILVTGATGYIGGRLVPELLHRGYRVRVMVRKFSPEHRERWPDAEIAVADALNVADLSRALEGVHTAYYLIHSMLLGKREFEIADLQAVTNFRFVAEEQNLKRIIYLGGLGQKKTSLSNHLRSRHNVAEIIKAGKVPSTIMQAAIIIGSGSASYEIIKNIVKNMPVFFLPRWASTQCQPISIRDIIKYLVGIIEVDGTAGRSFHICGKDILTYKDMIRSFARMLRKKRLYIRFPVSGTRLYSYAVSFLTPVPAQITHCLMEGVVNEVICRDESIKEVLPFPTLDYRESLLRALSREEQDNIYTRWSDAYPPAHELALKLSELKQPPRYISEYSIATDKPASRLFESICRIGGREGWFHNNWMWRFRGFIDRILMGVGTSRGRRSISTLRINDVIGFWRVEDMVRDSQLLLRAEMILPGRAWLEFRINRESAENLNRLSVHAYFSPKGLLGRLYWYNFLPFHFIIFKNLLKQLELRS